MNPVDEFSLTLLDEAKRFLEKAKETTEADGKQAYLHAALVLGLSALEAHVNGIADDFASQKELGVLERSLLSEKDFRLENGEFVLTNQLKMARLEDRLEFLHRKFSGTPIAKDAKWWSDLKSGIRLRNQLTHPKDIPLINEAAVEATMLAALDTLDVLYRAVYNVPYPLRRRNLLTDMTF